MVRRYPLLVLGFVLLLSIVTFVNGEGSFNCASDDVLQRSPSEVVPVPSGSAAEWFSFNRSVNQTVDNINLVLRSLNANCNVEIKFRDYAASPNTYLRVYPKGRSVAYNLPISLGYCSPYWSLWAVTLGSSALSLGQELGLVLYPRTTGGGIVAAFELWYRQRCPGDVLEATDGFQLPPPPVTGEPMSKTFEASLALPSNDYSKTLQIVILPPFPTCSVETTINLVPDLSFWLGIRSGPDMLDWNFAGYVGIPFLSPAGNATSLRLQTGTVIKLGVTYQAVCGSNASTSTRGGFRPPFQTPIRLLLSNWTSVELDMPNVAAHSVLMWRLRRDNPATTQILVEKDLWKSSTASMQFSDGFDRSIWSTPQDFDPNSEMVVSLSVFSSMPRVRFAFRARLISTLPVLDQSPISVTSESWQNFTVSFYKIVTTKWRLRSDRSDCRVEAGYPIIPQMYQDAPFMARIVRSSFNPNVSMPNEWVKDSYGVSFGQEIGLGFDIWRGIITSPQHGPIQWPYRLYCIITKLNSTLSSSWATVGLKAWGNELFFITVPSSPSVCFLDVSAISLSRDERGVNYRFIQIVCGDDWALTIANATVQTKPLSKCGLIHVTSLGDTYYPALLVYRVRSCAGEVTDHPISDDGNIGQVVHVDSRKWRKIELNHTYPDSDRHWPSVWYTPITTFRTEQPGCAIELLARNFDIVGGIIFEDLLQADNALTVQTPVARLKQLQTIAYISCSSKIYVRAGIPSWQQISVRQICPAAGASFSQLCGQLKQSVEATFQWQTMELVAQNPNQLRESMLQITLPALTNDQLAIELHFSSLVEQVLIGLVVTAQSGRIMDGAYDVVNVARVRTNGFPAFIGKSRLFRTNVTITTDILAGGGDHIFTAKFRLKNLTESRILPSLGVDVLVATKQTKSIKFNIPSQFSEARRQEIVQRSGFFVDDDYAPEHATGGRYYRWMFRRMWTIKPQTVGCRVRSRVIRLDIGSRATVLGRNLNEEQHRLAIGPTTPNPSAFDGHMCDDRRRSAPWPAIKEFWTVFFANSTQNFVCANVGPDYVSNPSSGLVVRFESLSREMPEYEAGPYIRIRNEAEETWGSGWELEYSQICDEDRANLIVNRSPIQIVATSKWQTLPISASKSANWELFQDIRYQISSPKEQCAVRVLWRTSVRNYQRILRLFDHRGHELFTGEYDPYSADIHELNVRARNFTVMVQSKVPQKRQGQFTFREECAVARTHTPSSLAPTPSPTMFPTVPAPTYGPTLLASPAKDGWSCYNSNQCQSGICSLTLLGCLAQTCAAHCKANLSSPTCDLFAQVGCACKWDVASKQCLILP